MRIGSSYSGKVSRFYPVVKEAKPLDSSAACKGKTRHSQNPPIESHVGWVLDSRNSDTSPPKYEPKTACNTTTTINANNQSASASSSGFKASTSYSNGNSSSKSGYATGTTPLDDSQLNNLSSSYAQSQDLVPFQHPSYSLLQQNGFTQQLYSKFRKRCLAGKN